MLKEKAQVDFFFKDEKTIAELKDRENNGFYFYFTHYRLLSLEFRLDIEEHLESCIKILQQYGIFAHNIDFSMVMHTPRTKEYDDFVKLLDDNKIEYDENEAELYNFLDMSIDNANASDMIKILQFLKDEK